MFRRKATALICACLALACGRVPAIAAKAGSSVLLNTAASRALMVPAAWRSISRTAWNADTDTATFADLLADDLATPPTAVYDIMARVVVLPDGVRLEAHSGLGERADDPRFVAARMRGATPPALYALEQRERLFHGIAALRLLPVSGDVFGRTGLLAHTYMLKGRPESNGCVVFRDYAAFLNAFRDGQIKRLRVVPSVGNDARLEGARTKRPAG